MARRRLLPIAFLAFLAFLAFSLLAEASLSDAGSLKLYPIIEQEEEGIPLSGLGISEAAINRNRHIQVPDSLKVNADATGYWLHRGDIAKLLKNQYPEIQFQILGPNKIKVECKNFTIPEDYIASRVISFFKELDSHGSMITVEVVEKIPQQQLCTDNYNLTMQRIGRGRMRSRESISVTLLSGSYKIRSFPVWLKVKAYKKAWIAEKNYNSGSRIELLSVREEYIDSAKLNSGVVEELPKGKRLAMAVAANEILTSSHIEDIPLVEQGKPIKVLSVVKNIRIVAIGRAKSDGDLGDTVFVQLEGHKNIFKGKVIAKQLVMVSS